MHRLAQLDHRYIWHPFTQMRDWLRYEPLVIVRGRGATVEDARGRRYLDANSSIWTNLHGHNHPKINAAIRAQLKKIAHSSALGLANEPASLLSERLMRHANPSFLRGKAALKANKRLSKVFFSDDGSTAMEVALKLAYEFARRSGLSPRPKFLSLEGAYHGDTVGAVSLGHIDLFHKAYSGLLFKTDHVMSPYCYRCPFNRAKPQRADARDYRKCNWECLDQLERKFAEQKRKANGYAAFVFEPLIQGAAGMIAQPKGWLRRAAEISRAHRSMLVADEIMTGFGRTGTISGERPAAAPRLFACHNEAVQPDFLALAKGLTGGYMPMAATLTTETVYEAFLGEYEEFKSFFHGHSYTANQLGSAAAIASIELLELPANRRARLRLEKSMANELKKLWHRPNIGDIRQVGLIAGVELVKDWRTREPFPLSERVGIRVCEAMARQGVLTRPIGNVIVLMPPYCTSDEQLKQIVSSLDQAVAQLFRTKRI